MAYRTYTNFAGGKNNTDKVGPIINDFGQTEAFFYCEDSKNWEMTPTGLIKKPGFDSVLDEPLTDNPIITGIFEYDNDGALELIVCADGYVYKVSGGTTTELYDAHTPDKFYEALQFQGKLLLFNGEDPPLQYDGATCIPIAFTDPDDLFDDATPKGAEEFRNNVWMWGDPTYPHRVYKPKPETYSDFDTSTNEVDAFDVAPGFGGKITGLKALTDDILVVFKEKAIYRIEGIAPFGATSDQIKVYPISKDVGCVAPRSILQVGLDIYYLGENGIRQLKPVDAYGDVTPMQPTYPIQDDVNSWNFTRTVIENACAVYDKPNNTIRFAVPGSGQTTNTLVYDYDVITQTNEPRGNGFAVACFGYFSREVYHGSYAGQVYQHDGSLDYNGAAISADWLSKVIAHQGQVYKIYRLFKFYAEGDGETTIIVQWKVFRRGREQTRSKNLGITASGAKWDEAIWDSAVWDTREKKIFQIKNPGRGQAMVLRFVNANTGQTPKIRQVDIKYDPCGDALG
jgi:hypothetical protein